MLDQPGYLISMASRRDILSLGCDTDRRHLATAVASAFLYGVACGRRL